MTWLPGADDGQFSPSDIQRILSDTFVQDVDYSKALPSTNTRALELAAGSRRGSSSPVLVIADVQTAGRGRGANEWWSDSGSLTFSLLFRPEELSLPASRWPQLSLTAGLAVCDAIESLVPGSQPLLKWPNDVLVDGRKVCGILVEASNGRCGNLVIGIGVNVNNTFQNVPPEMRTSVVALREISAEALRRVDALVAILQCLDSRIDWLSAGVESLRDEWSRRCILTGKNVAISARSRRIVGICEGIDRDGALLLTAAGRQERCLSGTILSFE